MKKLLLILATAALAATARADLTITEQVVQNGKTTTSVTKYKGDKVRMDPVPGTSVIFNLKTGDFVTLAHSQKAAMTMSGAAMKSMLNSAASEIKMEPPQATGKKETISGYECQEYVVKVNGGTIRMWVTDQLPAAQKLAADLAALSGEGPFATLMKNQNIPGYPLKTITEIPDMPTSTKTVVSLLKDDLPDSDFEVPKGYKSVAMPSIPQQ